jgi:hypothetical protein
MRDPLDGIMPKGLRSFLTIEEKIKGPNLKVLGATPLDKMLHEQKVLGASNLSSIVKARVIREVSILRVDHLMNALVVPIAQQIDRAR